MRTGAILDLGELRDELARRRAVAFHVVRQRA
jgi:hypothetical protein